MAFNPPLAYFFTFTTYGTRLHGDERGSTHKRDGYLEPDPGRVEFHERQLKHEHVLLNALMRGTVEDAIRQVCVERKIHIFALNVRTNHVHVVPAAGTNDAQLMIQFQARATKLLRERGLVSQDATVWTQGGSRKKLFTPKHVNDACEYVKNRQGADLPRG